MSIGAMSLSEAEFQQRIRRASKGLIEVSFFLGEENITNKQDDVNNIRHLKKLKWLPRKVSYPVICLKNLPFLMKQNILVAPGVGFDGLFVCLFCKLFGKKSMITIHGHYEEEWTIYHPSKLKLVLRTLYERIVLKFADLIVVNDDQIKDKLIDKGVSPSRISIRYVTADTEKFLRKNINKKKFQEVKRTYKLPDKYVLFVGHLGEDDGVMDLLRVFNRIHAELPTYRCVLVGYGGLCTNPELSKARISSFVTGNNLDNEVIQTGKVDYDLMPYLYYGSDIIILPTRPPAGGIGRIPLEALSMEIPVVTTDIGIFHRVVINDETGYRIPLGDIDLMASKALYLLKNPDLRRKFGSNGRRLVKSEYDVEIYINNWMNSIRFLSHEKEKG